MEARYDVFLSFSGDDRPRVMELYEALKVDGLRAFIDERGIRYGHGVSAEITTALRGSKTMLVYYSASFPQRSACQFELRYAYLTALRAGQVEQRILVVNPEDPATDHLLPLELSTNRYVRTWQSKRELAALVALVRQKAQALDGPFPGMDFGAPPPVHHRKFEPTVSFVGRYRDRWALHSALHRGDHPLMNPVTGPQVASLTGMTGMGKTSLAKVYVHDYGFLYPGGIYWTDLTGATRHADRVRAVHTARLRELAEHVDRPPGGLTRRQLLGWWSRYLQDRPGHKLWVVDAVPPGTPDDVIAELVPDVHAVHTLLIGQQELSHGIAAPVRLGGLIPEDGRELFEQHHPPVGDEVDAVKTVVARLGGHPYAIRFAATGARGRHGLWHLRDRIDHLTSDAGVLDRALAMTREVVEHRDGPERTVLVLSAVCAAEPIPAALIREVVGALEPLALARTAAVLTKLDQDRLVTQEDTSWQVHQLVREAMSQSAGQDELGAVAVVAARQLLALASTGTADLAPHARALLCRTTSSPDLSISLNELVAAHHDERGEPGLSAPCHENLYGWQPDRLDHLYAAARAWFAAGQHDKALAHADKLAELAPDDLTAMRAEHVQASVLDARTRHRDAEPIWQRLVSGPALASAPPEEQIAVRTGHVRNRRARGYFAEAKDRANALLAEMGDRFPEEVVPVRIELAAVGIATNDRIGSRAALQEIIDHYRRRGLPGHVNAIEAVMLLHESQLEVFILEALPGEEVWTQAELEMRKLVADLRRDLGLDNPRTLIATVAHLRAMVGQGAPRRVLDEYSALPSELAGHLGTDHRLYLRAVFLLGQARAQNGENQKAFDNYSHALAGQERVLGPGHPETLRTRYELAVQRLLLGDRAGAKREFDAVRRDIAEKVGYRNDLYGQALTAGVLASFLPSSAVRAFDWLGRHLDKKRES
ncbi:tetratricopeptide repeat protein [Lentzea aerocolonigenes]|uniref:tetratricopeptide repeat protein n=1 Tax=Lentzea aerocolonigenes TaxID=68170 RepID=UPI000A4ADC9D|nr:TIR domain-containing protein [Lentzea aerocolonigenes]MCP2241332.1 TIR domain-containing protein [Lentzea aerocolonigenes]